MNKMLHISVVYAPSNDEQPWVTLTLPQGATIQDAIEQSGLMPMYPDTNLLQQAVGIYGQKREVTDVLQEGDRVEIYRPLKIDPKEARRLRAAKKSK